MHHPLVTTWLLGPTRLLNSKKLSRLHAYLAVTLIRQLRVPGMQLLDCQKMVNQYPEEVIAIVFDAA